MKYAGAVILMSSVLLASALAVSINHRYSDGVHVVPAAISPNSSATVLVVGDSWAADGVLDAPIQSALARRGIRVTVSSHGYPGERTGKIYEHIAALSETATTCVIVAGVNDSVGHFGPRYYAHHIRLLATLALQRGCSPVVVQLPQYDQVGAESRVTAEYLRLRNFLYQYVFDHGQLVSINQYRDQVRVTVADLPVKFVFPDGAIGTPRTRPELWKNPSHLSPSGCAALGEAIASVITSKPDTTQ